MFHMKHLKFPTAPIEQMAKQADQMAVKHHHVHAMGITEPTVPLTPKTPKAKSPRGTDSAY